MAAYDVSEISREQLLDQLADPTLGKFASEVRQLASGNDDPAAGEIPDPSPLPFPRPSAGGPTWAATELQGSR
jgi:hypothetical protein